MEQTSHNSPMVRFAGLRGDDPWAEPASIAKTDKATAATHDV